MYQIKPNDSWLAEYAYFSNYLARDELTYAFMTLADMIKSLPEPVYMASLVMLKTHVLAFFQANTFNDEFLDRQRELTISTLHLSEALRPLAENRLFALFLMTLSGDVIDTYWNSPDAINESPSTWQDCYQMFCDLSQQTQTPPAFYSAGLYSPYAEHNPLPPNDEYAPYNPRPNQRA